MENIHITVNVVDRVSQYLDFLETYATNPEWQRENVLKRALRRYEELWLPLMSELRHLDLEPPRDVKWVWHLHLLKPTQYRNYCVERFGHVLPHALRGSSSDERYARERTAGIWKDKYMQEPYELEPDLQNTEKYSRSSRFLAQTVEMSMEHTPALVYQYALPHYRDRTFREGALQRYKHFLYVWHRQQDEDGGAAFLQQITVPYDIQLMWRIHCMYPQEYYNDMKKTQGSSTSDLLDFIDITANSMGGGTSRLTQYVLREWRDNEPLEAAGTGFRGTGLYSIDNFPADKIPKPKVESCDITINDVLLSDFWSGETRFVVEAKRLGDTSFSYTSIFMREGKPGRTISSLDSDRGLGTIIFHSKYHRGIEFHIFGRKGRWCTKKEHHIATVFYNPTDTCSNGSFHSQSKSVNIAKISATDPTVKFSITIKAAAKESLVLSMDRGVFTQTPLPEPLREFMSQSIDTEEGDYRTAKHSLRGKHHGLELEAEVIKCDEAALGAVLISCTGEDGRKKLVTVAHSIGAEQLPHTHQVSPGFPVVLNPGDHGMLLRNAAGDWALVLGHWEEVKSSRESEGQVVITLYPLHERRRRGEGARQFIVRDDELHSMDLGDVKVDMPTGRITISPDCTQVAEWLSVAFCAGMIFLSCQKQILHHQQQPASLSASTKSLDSLSSNASSKYNTTSSRYTSTSSSRYNTASSYNVSSKHHAKMSKKKNRRRKMSASFTFLLASGLQMDSYYYSGPSASTSSVQGDVILSNKAGDVRFTAQRSSSSSHFTGDAAGAGLGASLASLPTQTAAETGSSSTNGKVYTQNCGSHNGRNGVNDAQPWRNGGDGRKVDQDDKYYDVRQPAGKTSVKIDDYDDDTMYMDIRL